MYPVSAKYYFYYSVFGIYTLRIQCIRSRLLSLLVFVLLPSLTGMTNLFRYHNAQVWASWLCLSDIPSSPVICQLLLLFSHVAQMQRRKRNWH